MSNDEELLSSIEVARILDCVPDEVIEDEKLLSSKEVAEILDCAPDEVLKLARTGKIRATKQGKYWRFLRRDIGNYMKRKGEEG